ncbi:protein Niban 1a isoform X2 [Stegostoma tigrinum]|uniref:protein Niban 1a isoform X2 n=1 Tax=Stegostoma tigrinum TaxID=3053191 RepID=UPI002870660C|nr:protein Niban 1a isoform X2 [Stegostoma tigrinum]
MRTNVIISEISKLWLNFSTGQERSVSARSVLPVLFKFLPSPSRWRRWSGRGGCLSEDPGKAEAELKNFCPHYQRQYSVAAFNHIRCEVQQDQEAQPQLLQHKDPKRTEKVVYQQEVIQYIDEFKKWKERYVVIKNDNSMECYENKEVYQKGGEPKCKQLPTGYRVLTSMIEYALLVDKYFPDPSASGKDGNQSFLVNHTQYSVYLWHPYRKHSYFCFENEETQREFWAVLNDCIRHLNYEFAEQSSFEVQAFSEAIQFFRQEKGHYGSWEMNHGNEALILSNLVMEELLPSLQSDILPKMKGKKNEKRKAWFNIVEEAYNLVQNQLVDGLQSLQDECRKSVKDLEGIIRSDMDQIITSKEFAARKLKAIVAEEAEKCCLENIQPYLASILDELMGLISSGFTEVRSLFETKVDELSAKCQEAGDTEKLKEYLNQLMNLPFDAVRMQPCYNKVSPLQDQLQELKNRFKFTNTQWLIQTTQNIMQELMDNAVYTFEQLLSDLMKGNPPKVTSVEKIKQRVLKQFDHDSSTVRKKLFQEALVQIALPTLQKALAPNYKRKLQKFEEYIFADYTKLIQVENIYEEILLETVLKEVVKVVNEAAILKKHNLFEDNMTYTSDSDSNLTDKNEGKTPPDSQSRSPAKTSSEGSDAEGLETEEKITLQMSSPATESSLNEKQECEPSSASQDNILHTTLDSKQSGEVIMQVDANQEPDKLITLDNQNNNDNVPTSECQNRQAETQEERIPAPAPDSLKEIHDLLTVAVVPVEEGPETQKAISSNDEIHSQVDKEPSPKLDEHLKDIDEMKEVDVSAVELVDGQSEENKEPKVENILASVEELVQSHSEKANELKALQSTVEELGEEQSEEDDESKGSQSTIEELLEDHGEEDREPKGSPPTVEELLEEHGEEDKEPKNSPSMVEELEHKTSPSTTEESMKNQSEEEESKEDLTATVNNVADEDKKAAEPLKQNECPAKEPCVDSIESNHVSESTPMLHKEGVQEVQTVDTTDTEIALDYSEKDKEQNMLSLDEANEGEKNSQM